jgi:hypothetical protein
MGEWEDLQEEGAREGARTDAIDALIGAGLSGALTWSQVEAAAEVIEAATDEWERAHQALDPGIETPLEASA